MVIRKLDVKFFCRRKNVFRILMFLLVVFVLVCYARTWFMMAGYYPRWTDDDVALRHYQWTRNLSHYLSDIQLVIEPISAPCSQATVPVIILVASPPSNFIYRQGVRKTWGRYVPTYFVLGMDTNYVGGDQLKDNQNEADLYDDILVFEFLDHQQTQTLKTALMIQWTTDHCPQAEFILKTKDNVMINPRTLRKVLKENHDAKLIGYKQNIILVHRYNPYKWYLPEYLYRFKIVPQYLDGCGYLINGKYLKAILEKARHVPIVNFENIYFTYIVAHKGLGLTLTHDWRLSPKRPWLSVAVACTYQSLALTHGYPAKEMISTWWNINAQDKNESSCGFVDALFRNNLFLN